MVFMKDYNLSQSDLVVKLGCTPEEVGQILEGHRGITASFATQLEVLFGISAEAWMRMQAEYDSNSNTDIQ